MEYAENSVGDSATREPLQWPDRPWLSIWIRPRDTIRAIVRVDPERHVILLAAIAGIGEALGQAVSSSMGNSVSVVTIFLAAVIVGPLVSVISLYVGSAVLSWISGWFGGKAPAGDIRAASAWSFVPNIAAMSFWIVYLPLYGSDMFTTWTPRIQSQPLPLIFLGVVELILGLWSFVIFLKGFAEVNKFSAWRALLVVVSPAAAILLLFAFCGLVWAMTAA